MKHPIAALLLALLAACTPAEGPPSDALAVSNAAADVDAQPFDDAFDIPSAVVMDPPRDGAHPARNRQLVIPSGPIRPELGRPAEMNALFLLAVGEGPKPTLLLLHGLPGNERNLDLAQAVRRAGWNVLAFTYRGAWGSEGVFSIRHAIEDARAALAFLRSPQAAREYDVDPTRLVLAGHSMGGMAAAMVAAEHAANSARPEPVESQTTAGRRPTSAGGPDQRTALAGLILLDAWNAGATARLVRAAGQPGRAAFIAELDDLGRAVGPITAADLADELLRRGEAWELTAHAAALARLPVLSVYASEGLAAENRALAQAIRAQGGARLRAVELATDHAFADHRIALAAQVVRWLDSLSPAP